MFFERNRRVTKLLAVGILTTACAWATPSLPTPTLDHGFRLLYSLKFDEAQQSFSQWQQQNPSDPMGPASEGAGLLFSELDRLGILESQFFEDDKSFADRKKMAPDAAVRGRFQAALDRAEVLAKAHLAKDPKDHDALLAMVMVNGLQADYAGLIEKRNFASLSYTKQGTNWAQQLLAVDPNAYDAYLARILLAIAYVRDKDKGQARQVLASLHDDFPENGLFVRELQRLQPGSSQGTEH